MAAMVKYRPTFSRPRSSGAALARLRGQLEGLKKARSAVAARTAGKGNVFLASGLTVAGGAAAGALQAKFPQVAGIDSRAIAGGAAVLLGAFVLKGKAASMSALIGAGILASWSGDMVEDVLTPDAV